jgi:hypothetical protein
MVELKRFSLGRAFHLSRGRLVILPFSAFLHRIRVIFPSAVEMALAVQNEL